MGGLLWNTAALSGESRQPPYGPGPAPLDGPELPSFRYPLGAQKTEQFNGGTAMLPQDPTPGSLNEPPPTHRYRLLAARPETFAGARCGASRPPSSRSRPP